jgi:inner membrane protein
MDPLTQGTLGAAAAQSAADRRQIRSFAVAGAFGGLVPDLDILIRSDVDPLLYLEYHRQFTHSLVFIPVGAAICALVLYPWLKKSLDARSLYLACLLGYATHGLLDACTSYGTQLFWPFSDYRVAWNLISVVDPVFSVPLFAAAVAGYLRRSRRIAVAGLVWAGLYFIFGFVQQDRALVTAERLAADRGHSVDRITVKPAFANLLLWKSVYESDGRYFVDAVRAGVRPTVCEGEHIERLEPSVHLPWLDERSVQAREVERFGWYSDGWLAMDRDEPLYVVDVRYSSLPNRIDALWGLKLDARAPADAHAVYHVVRERRTEALEKLLGLLAGRGCRLL